jgi:WavE lipopolysaccharide synthesis
MGKKISKYLVRKGVGLYERLSGNFLTLTIRPKQASGVQLMVHRYPSLPRMAIVLQGPIEHKDNFTLETVKLYRSILPDTLIIVSTWSTEPAHLRTTLEEAGATVVCSTPPANRGPRNINYQIISTRAGIEHAQSMGAMYVCKSRTDQRLYAPQSLVFLYSLLQQFPYTAPYSEQKERIAICSHETLKYRLYGATDQLMFGTIADMSLYWNAPLDEREAGVGNGVQTLLEAATAHTCETYLETMYLHTLGQKIDYTFLNSFQVLDNHFILFDKRSVELYWPKYDHYLEERFSKYEERTTNYLTFRDWLTLHYTKEITVEEKFLHNSIQGVIKN